MSSWSRRRFLETSLSASGALLPGGLTRSGFGQTVADPRFLIVLTGTGGASIVDSFLAVRESESRAPKEVNAYPDSLVQLIGNLPFRAIDFSSEAIGAIPSSFTANQSNFVKKYGQDMMVVTHTGTSVNHRVAEHRSVNGNAAWKGRTLQEAVALQYGAGHPIPNVHLVNGTGFTERGTDDQLPSYAYGEHVSVRNLWPLSLDWYKGVDGAPSRELFEKAREFRNQQLDPGSDFYSVFKKSDRVRHWLEMRVTPCDP